VKTFSKQSQEEEEKQADKEDWKETGQPRFSEKKATESEAENVISSCLTAPKLIHNCYNNNNNDRLTAFDPGQPG